MSNSGALLADEMGTGKTVMTIVALRILFQQGKIHKALIVCPVSVLHEWNRHLAEWAPELVVTFVRGNNDVRELDWKMNAHVYVTTYDTVRIDLENSVMTVAIRFDLDVIVVDEAQNIKNPASGRSRVLKKLKARYRWALTGTPVENKIEDMAAIYDFLRPGYLIAHDLTPTRIRERVAPYFLRRRKADVLPDLPPKIVQEHWLELDQEQHAAYESALGEVRSELLGVERVTKPHIFRIINRLKQICNFAPGATTSPKLDLLKEQIEEITSNGHKLIVFSQYIGEGLDKLESALQPYGTAKIAGGQSDAVRGAEIERFKKRSNTPILLASLRAGGVGLNLTEASYVVHFDQWWNPAVMWQAEARVHRPGQVRGVNVYAYWVENTIEERIYQKLKEKGILFEAVVEGLAETSIDELISTDEWLEMLGVIRPDRKPPEQEPTNLDSMGLVDIRNRLLQLSPAKFEELVKGLMEGFGYPNVKVTGRSGDGGLDVVSTRNTLRGSVKAVAQCKRYAGTVGVEVARALRGAMAVDLMIEKGYLVTTGEFSAGCLAFCAQTGVIEAIDGLTVAKYVQQFGLTLD